MGQLARAAGAFALLALAFVLASTAPDSVPTTVAITAPAEGATVAVQSPYNFVVILTDDQRWDTLTPEIMPNTWARLVQSGVNFMNAVVTTPLCCPDRSSLLSGGFYAHNTGVLTNALPNGGAQKFKDADTLATRLQAAGYHTAMIGKYLNQYEDMAPYIPPGWTTFIASQGGTWFDYDVVIGSSTGTPSRGIVTPVINTYRMDFQRDRALEFIRQAGAHPFFLYLATNAPHDPATPAPGDENLFSGFTHRNRAYGETDMSDKPEWVRAGALDYDAASEDVFHRNQLRSLQAVDRALEAIVTELQTQGTLDHTIFFFTSDNGFLWGEHGMRAKGKAYEESIRVPMVVRLPGVPPRIEDKLVASNLDLGPTIFELAEIPGPAADGASLVPLLENPNTPWRQELLIEGSYGEHDWAGIRTADHTYVEYFSGESELYDLSNDPYELTSQHANPSYATLRNQLAASLQAKKGVTITTHDLPSGKVAQRYTFQLQAWGGGGGYTWNLAEGSLPAGLSLSADGVISGTPTQEGTSQFSVRVRGAAIRRQAGGRQAFVRQLTMVVAKTDTAPPTVAIIAPTAGRTVSGIITVAAAASDNVEIVKVRFFVDGVVADTDTANPYLFSWDTTSMANGAHTLKAKAFDAAGNTATHQISVTVQNIPPNQPPVVSAGPDQTSTLPASAALDGTVTDDGLPNPPGTVTTTWTKVSGPGTVTFGTPAAVDTSASFSSAGTYVLRLTASDSALTSSDEVTLTVNSESPYTLTASPSTVAPGGSLTVSWTAPSGRPTYDWIGLYKVGDPNTAYQWWTYTVGATTGSVTLTAPTTPGTYEFRYLLNNGYTDAARSNPVTVQ